MKFKVAFPNFPVGQRVSGTYLEKTGRFFSCFVCEYVTDWFLVDSTDPGCPICSDECLDEYRDQQEELQQLESKTHNGNRDSSSGPLQSTS